MLNTGVLLGYRWHTFARSTVQWTMVFPRAETLLLDDAAHRPFVDAP
jgi:hypothetical protein